jgi:hypothetical protein
MTKKSFRITVLPFMAALTILMCGSVTNEAAGAKAPAGHADGNTTGATEAKPASPKKMCTEHGLPEAECGICHPDMAAKLKPGQGSKIRLPAADSANLVGVELAQATVGEISEGIECYAELAFNQNRLAQTSAPRWRRSRLWRRFGRRRSRKRLPRRC